MRYKCTMLAFQFHEGEALAQYLELQARNGWYLQCPSFSGTGIFQIWKKGEKADRRFAAVLLDGASEWDTGSDRRLRELCQLCQEFGWNYYGTYGLLQLFWTEQKDAPPLETDDALRLDIYRETVWKKQVPGYGILLLILLAGIVILAKRWDVWLFDLRAIAEIGAVSLAWAALAAYLLHVFGWYRRSVRQLAKGGGLQPVSLKQVWRESWFSAVLVGSVVLLLILRQPKGFRLLFLAGTAASIVLICWLEPRLRKWIRFVSSGTKEEDRRALVIFLVICVVILENGIYTAVGSLGLGMEPGQETDSSEMDLELPISLEELGYRHEGQYAVFREGSFLASRQGASYGKPETGSLVSICWYGSEYSWVVNYLQKRVRPDRGNLFSVKEELLFQEKAYDIRRYLYEADHPMEDLEPGQRGYTVYVLKTEKEILVLDFQGMEDPELVEAAGRQLLPGSNLQAGCCSQFAKGSRSMNNIPFAMHTNGKKHLQDLPSWIIISICQ